VEGKEGVHDRVWSSNTYRGFTEVVFGLDAMPDGLVHVLDWCGFSGGAKCQDVVGCVFVDTTYVVTLWIIGPK